jgi:hypothetical protein
MKIEKRIFFDADNESGAEQAIAQRRGDFSESKPKPPIPKTYTFPVQQIQEAELHFEGYETLLYGKDKSGCIRVFYRSEKAPRQIYQNECYQGHRSSMMGQLKKEWARMLIADFGSSVRYFVPQAQIETLIASSGKERL